MSIQIQQNAKILLRIKCIWIRNSGTYSAAFHIVPYRQSNHSYGTVPTVTSFKDLLSFYREAMEKDFSADVNAMKIFQSLGNDLSTPQLPHFPGLRQGNNWCLCVSRY
jgi:hypothetical protein